MSIQLTAQDLAVLVGGKAGEAPLQGRFFGVAIEAGKVRGGELFVWLGSSEAALHEAVERGAALCMAEASSASKLQGPAVLVQNVGAALAKLAAWWRTTHPVPLVGVPAGGGGAVTGALLAVMLLKTGRGSYVARGGDDELQALAAVCNINPEHRWAVVELPENPSPQLLHVLAPALVTEERCAAGGVTSVVGHGLRGITVEMRAGDEKLALDIALLGKHNAPAVAAAVFAARQLAPELTSESLAAACRRFTTPPGRMSLRSTNAGRHIIDDSARSDMLSISQLLDFLAEVGEFAYVMERQRRPGDTEAIAGRLAALRPTLVVAVAPDTESLALIKKAGVAVMPAVTPEAAAHIVHKLPAPVVAVSGGGRSLARAVETLLELEGELIPEGTLR